MIFHENRLPADDSHDEIIMLYLFLKKQQNCCLLQIIGSALWVKRLSPGTDQN